MTKVKNFIFNRVRYLITVKSDITCVFSHDCAKIKVDSYDSLPLEKTLIFHNVIIQIVLVFRRILDILKKKINKIISEEKNYKYFIGCLYDDYKIKSWHIIIPKINLHVKSYDGQSK